MKPVSNTKISKADYADLADCEIVLVTATTPAGNAKTCNELIGLNRAVEELSWI